jgi:hypothetical protein
VVIIHEREALPFIKGRKINLLEAISCSQIPVVPRFFPDKPKMAI